MAWTACTSSTLSCRGSVHGGSQLADYGHAFPDESHVWLFLRRVMGSYTMPGQHIYSQPSLTLLRQGYNLLFAHSLALDPTFGIHSHKTLDTAQPCHLLKPNWKPSSSHSISIRTYISTLFLLQSLCVYVCVCVRACVRVCVRANVCVCVCVFVVRFFVVVFCCWYNPLCKLFW